MARNYYNNDFYYPEFDKENPKRNDQIKKIPKDEKVFFRYDEGAKRYSMCKHSFMKLAADAGAVYKINKISLVNTKIFEEYLETFRVEGE